MCWVASRLAKLLFTQSRYAISATSSSQHVQHTLVAAVRAVRHDSLGQAGGGGQSVAEASGEQLTPHDAATLLRGMSAPERGEAFFLMFMRPMSVPAALAEPLPSLAESPSVPSVVHSASASDALGLDRF